MGSIQSESYLPPGCPDFEKLPDEYSWPRENGNGYRIREMPCGSERPIRVVSLGAGVSGINLAKILPEKVNNLKLVIYEKNPEVGGTWYENKYPGVACDVPSNNYQFTWARKPDWKHFYSSGEEIFDYFQDVVDFFDLRKYFHLNHEVRGAYWDEEEGVWNIHVKNLKTGQIFLDTAEVFINNGGFLNKWRWPEIEGLKDFKGQITHTAKWRPDTRYEGKSVAVIGTGSSGVQVIPYIAPKVNKLYTWIRSPTWITAGFAQQYAGPNGTNFEYTEEQKQQWIENPLDHQRYCKAIEDELNQRFKFILKGSPQAEEAKTFSTLQMKEKLGGRTDIEKKIIPTEFGVGCRRPTPGNGFLESLSRPNVQVFTEMMKRITKEGFIDHAGHEHKVDVIICATGFDTSWIPQFPIIAHGSNVQDVLRKNLISYLSIAMPDVPNYFTIAGPYGPFGHGSYIAVSEMLVENISAVVKKIQKENIKSVTPDYDVCQKFAEHADLYIQRTAWSGPCSSWFKNGDKNGRLAMWPGSRLTYFDVLSEPRFEDYHIKYWSGNPFEYLGNGFALVEFNGGDISYYLGTDESPGGVLPPKQIRDQH
ncbi:FAD/NAD-P-binding domain-containing protein [Talaromyces proteolyticus]|uniref:FAD/NAD-P-binding domain-containing protein n=1 Tax=Talaromyces proteolyticus TaxID=1131652 RepID=A0AAD4PUF4_9EURO|nr:FAD/NAD-P-binding domain-containing protein [Talaromyces proteolyticus]KAH8689342.1 FAD/NAD-P-binding domain-containing protein [Talaromyces proteolyticus]